MLINNTEALKSWLVVVLAPLCDADSSALARYVLALLKKDKPEIELKRVMIEQLDVFLGDETTPFVDRLFAAIGTEEYLATAAIQSQLSTSTTTMSPTAVKIENEFDIDNLSLLSAVAEEALASATAIAAATTTTAVSSATTTTTTTTTTNPLPTNNNNNNSLLIAPKTDKSDNTTTKLEHHNDVHLKHSAYAEISKYSINDESKTKEANHQKTAVNEACVNNNHPHKTANSTTTTIEATAITGSTDIASSSSSSFISSSNSQQRHVSPLKNSSSGIIATAADKENQPRESRRQRVSQHSRSRTRSRSPERYSRRSRSPRDRRGNQRQFRNKSPSSSVHERRRGVFGRGERQRPSGGGGGGNNNNNNNNNNSNNSSNIGSSNTENTRKNRSNPHSLSPSPERRVGNLSGQTSLPHKVGGAIGVQEQENGSIEKRQRCRDFDEKGYCVRGETCPWDHGINPVVFEGLNNPALITMSLREYNPDAPDLWSRATTASGLPSAGLVVGGSGPAGINPFSGAPRNNTLSAPGVAGGSIVYPAHVPPLDKVSVAGGPSEYARNSAANVAYRGAPLMQFPFNAAPMQQRELIPIPVVDAESGNAAGLAAAPGNDGGNHLAHQPLGKRRFDLLDDHAVAGLPDSGPTKRKLPLNSRLGPRVPANMQSNCSLELRKVPRGLNTIAHLNNHFAKFGKIVNIQISYEGDPEAAIVTFSTHAEANVAYRSTEAVLNNRFIKVFWHTEAAATGETNANATINGARKSNHHYHLNNLTAAATANAASNSDVTANKTTITAATNATTESNNKDNSNASNNSGNTTTNTTTTEAATPVLPNAMAATHVTAMSMRLKNNLSRPNVNNAGMRKKQEEQAKAVVHLANGLRKRKQELLQSYVKQMKSALELVERCEPQDAQRAKTLETIKVLQETIDKLRKEIAAEQEQIQAQITSNQQPAGNANAATGTAAAGGTAVSNTLPPVKKTKEQQKKELLDIELELFAQQQEGNDTTAIQKRLEELQRSLGIGNAPGGISGGQQTVGGAKIGNFSSNPRVNPRALRGAVFPEGPTRVDRRPKTIVITGFVSEEADFVLGHFKHFGEILKHDMDREIPQLILSYATRMSAEQAVMRGKMYKGKRLQISWAPVINNPTSAAVNDTKHAIKQEKLDKPEDASQNIKIKQEQEVVEEKPNVTLKDVATFSSGEEKRAELILSDKLNEDALLPELRLEDEEEEEESEDRSWRR